MYTNNSTINICLRNQMFNISCSNTHEYWFFKDVKNNQSKTFDFSLNISILCFHYDSEKNRIFLGLRLKTEKINNGYFKIIHRD
jgi:hypothetical protein